MSEDVFCVEYVCTGNNFRSPLAMSAARKYVRAKGLDHRIKVISSGCGVEYFGKEAAPEVLLHFVHRMLEVGTLQGHPILRFCARMLLKKDERSLKREKVMPFVRFFERYEQKCRIKIMRKLGFDAYERFQNPTQPYSLTNLILYTGKSQKSHLERVFFCASRKPEMHFIQEFIGSKEPLPDCWGKPLEDYQKMAAALIQSVEKSIDKIAEEYLQKAGSVPSVH